MSALYILTSRNTAFIPDVINGRSGGARSKMVCVSTKCHVNYILMYRCIFTVCLLTWNSPVLAAGPSGWIVLMNTPRIVLGDSSCFRISTCWQKNLFKYHILSLTTSDLSGDNAQSDVLVVLPVHAHGFDLAPLLLQHLGRRPDVACCLVPCHRHRNE